MRQKKSPNLLSATISIAAIILAIISMVKVINTNKDFVLIALFASMALGGILFLIQFAEKWGR